MNARYRPAMGDGKAGRASAGAHAQRLRRRGRPRPDRGDGELPERGRLDRGAGRSLALYGRPEAHRTCRLSAAPPCGHMARSSMRDEGDRCAY